MKKIYLSLFFCLALMLPYVALGQTDQAVDRLAAEKVFKQVDPVLLNWADLDDPAQIAQFSTHLGKQVVIKVLVPVSGGKSWRNETHKLSKKQMDAILAEKSRQINQLNRSGSDSSKHTKAFEDFSNWLSMDYFRDEEGKGALKRAGIGEWRWDVSGSCSQLKNTPIHFNQVKLEKQGNDWKLAEVQIIKVSYLLP